MKPLLDPTLPAASYPKLITLLVPNGIGVTLEAKTPLQVEHKEDTASRIAHPLLLFCRGLPSPNTRHATTRRVNLRDISVRLHS